MALQLLGLGFDDLCGSCLCSGGDMFSDPPHPHSGQLWMMGGWYTESSIQKQGLLWVSLQPGSSGH